MGSLLTGGTIGDIGLNQMKKMREQTIKKWSELGFLEGLSGHVKENIAQLYEGQASTMLNEVDEEKPIPIVKKVFDQMDGTPILGGPKLPKDLYLYLKKDNEESEGTSITGSTI